VDHVKSDPMTYRIFGSEKGDRSTLEFRVSVLSSQHQDSLFRFAVFFSDVEILTFFSPRLRIGFLDVASNVAYEVTSDPIRVLSKPSQVSKYLAKHGLSLPSPPPKSGKRNSGALSDNSEGGKKTSNELILEALARLETKQEEQQLLINKLLLERKKAPADFGLGKIPDPNDMDFGDSFAAFLAAFDKVPREERPQKLRRVLSVTPATGKRTMDDFMDIYRLTCYRAVEDDSDASCGCTDCPFKKEAASWNNFYSNFLSSPDSAFSGDI
jgi:hypothetical protein